MRQVLNLVLAKPGIATCLGRTGPEGALAALRGEVVRLGADLVAELLFVEDMHAPPPDANLRRGLWTRARDLGTNLLSELILLEDPHASPLDIDQPTPLELGERLVHREYVGADCGCDVLLP